MSPVVTTFVTKESQIKRNSETKRVYLKTLSLMKKLTPKKDKAKPFGERLHLLMTELNEWKNGGVLE